MPTTQTIDGQTVITYSDAERAEGVTKARILGSLERVRAGLQPWADDAAYTTAICAAAGLQALPPEAAESYYDLHAARTIAQLEQALADAIEAAQDHGAEGLPTPTVSGVPTRVPRRKAKTLMELTPAAGFPNLWEASLAAASGIEDNVQRVITRNYLLESLYFETATVKSMAASLLGMSGEQVDQLMVAAEALPG